jgi:hypothetical protein
MARRNPSTAPIKAPDSEAFFNDWTPLPANTKLPPYAIAAVQKITRTRFMGAYLSISKYCHTWPPNG